MTLRQVVVVGASLAGLRAAEALRHAGYDGRLTMVGGEDRLPYDRPPLSKQVLAGKWDLDRIDLRPVGKAIPDLDLDLRLGQWATGLDLEARQVALGDERLGYDGLLVATGATVRTLPGTEQMAGVHTLRTLDDCLALRADFEATPGRVVVIGAGFIGAEVAATARGWGLEVTVIEALPTPLYRGLGTEMGLVAADLHRSRGTDLRLGVGVDGLETDSAGRVSRVRLTDGSAIDATVVVVGIGVRPTTDWLEGSGLTLDNGLVCDETLLAAPGVVAAGDLVRWPNRQYGELMRLEHWENAVEMGRAAGLRLVAGDHDSGWDGQGAAPFESVGWFWSDQYDRKIQLAGHAGPDDQVEVVLGSVEDHRFVALYHQGDRLTAVLGFSQPGPVVKFRQLLVGGGSLQAAHELAASLKV